ncbi:MAG: hypothetical protein ACTSUE_17785 [Promethearchaeota archaeon]
MVSRADEKYPEIKEKITELARGAMLEVISTSNCDDLIGLHGIFEDIDFLRVMEIKYLKNLLPSLKKAAMSGDKDALRLAVIAHALMGTLLSYEWFTDAWWKFKKKTLKRSNGVVSMQMVRDLESTILDLYPRDENLRKHFIKAKQLVLMDIDFSTLDKKDLILVKECLGSDKETRTMFRYLTRNRNAR